MDYRSLGDTRLTINGSRHYKTPYGSLPSVTTILSATSGSKAALERWAKKNPGGREAAAARGTKVHSLMEDYLLGVDKNPEIEDIIVSSENSFDLSSPNKIPSQRNAKQPINILAATISFKFVLSSALKLLELKS